MVQSRRIIVVRKVISYLSFFFPSRCSRAKLAWRMCAVRMCLEAVCERFVLFFHFIRLLVFVCRCTKFASWISIDTRVRSVCVVWLEQYHCGIIVTLAAHPYISKLRRNNCESYIIADIISPRAVRKVTRSQLPEQPLTAPPRQWTLEILIRAGKSLDDRRREIVVRPSNFGILDWDYPRGKRTIKV